jgi:HD-GYP domain-containing protein (c-di-GMP phosphodiesterase class II)
MSELDLQDRIPAALWELVKAVNSARYYGLDHPSVGAYARVAYREISGVLAAVPSVTLFIVADRLVIEGRSSPSPAPFIGRFIDLLRNKGIERLSFHRGVTAEELGAFIVRLAVKDRGPVRSSPGIRLGKVEFQGPDGPPPNGPSPVEDGIVEAAGRLGSLGDVELERIREMYEIAERRKRLDVGSLDGIVKRFIGILLADFNPISLLASVKGAHEYTFTHVVNVGILTIVQAKNLGFSGRVLHEIGVASMLHDVGKIFIPDDILSKPGRLSAAERAVIETHTIKGGRYLLEQEGIPTIAVLAALEHHRKFDGSGYPVLRSGWRPNLISQMISISDVYDALRSVRSYSRAKPRDEILRILADDKGEAFNPRLVGNFLALVAGTI